AVPTMTIGSSTVGVIALLAAEGFRISRHRTCASNAGSIAPRSTRPLALEQPLGATSSRLFEQLAPDQPAANLAGARTDLVQLGIAQQSSRREVIDVAVAAQQLHRIERDLRRLLGGEEDGAGSVLARGLAPIAGLGHRINVGATGIHGR